MPNSKESTNQENPLFTEDPRCKECGYFVDDMGMCASIEGLEHDSGFMQCRECQGTGKYCDDEDWPCVDCYGVGLIKKRG